MDEYKTPTAASRPLTSRSCLLPTALPFPAGRLLWWLLPENAVPRSHEGVHARYGTASAPDPPMLLRLHLSVPLLASSSSLLNPTPTPLRLVRPKPPNRPATRHPLQFPTPPSVRHCVSYAPVPPYPASSSPHCYATRTPCTDPAGPPSSVSVTPWRLTPFPRVHASRYPAPLHTAAPLSSGCAPPTPIPLPPSHCCVSWLSGSSSQR